MNRFLLSQYNRAGKVPASSEYFQESIYPNHQEVNITDGGEFLDDTLRMREQPLAKTMAEEHE